MMLEDEDPEAFLNAFESLAQEAWAESQWASILIPCLMRPTQQVMDTIPVKDVCDYVKVKEAIRQTLCKP